ncbi:MAG TPA: response regulator [Ideonella sp.]|nr:response regulator [Ideonella sp.]
MKPLDEGGVHPVVLVVDDAPSSLGVLCETLETAGYTVLVARDGDAALRRLALVTPDAILLDAVMPGLSGFDTCRRIKADDSAAHIPVIFMTGLSQTAHVLEGFACGGVDYVVKPLRAPEVLARLHTHLHNARATRLAHEAVEALRSAEAQAAERLANAALTPRETEVLSWLAKGKTNRDIGEILGLSPRTVNKHLEHIFQKLGVETRSAAAALASAQMAS